VSCMWMTWTTTSRLCSRRRCWTGGHAQCCEQADSQAGQVGRALLSKGELRDVCQHIYRHNCTAIDVTACRCSVPHQPQTQSQYTQEYPVPSPALT
jgi:hypothetical protein